MIAAIVLAAGRSTRMGKPKQTLPLGGEPMLQTVLKGLRRTKVDLVVVVLGAGADEVRKKVKMEQERVVVNRAYRKGMSESLKLGLKSVEKDADAALIVLADQPFVSSATVDRIMDAYKESGAAVVTPVYKGLRGNPVLFDRSLFAQIMKLSGDVGAKSVVEANKEKLLTVEVVDRGVVMDLDTPSDYEGATSRRVRNGRSPGST